MVLNLRGGGYVNQPAYHLVPNNGEMSIGAGGLIKQSILRDPHLSSAWDSDNTVMFNVQLLSAGVFQRVTGMAPPPSPVTTEHYAAAGVPFYNIQGEGKSGVKGLFSDVKSVGQMDRENGVGGLERELAFPTIQLDKTGQKVAFRAVDQLVADVKAWGIATDF
jgi:hypothetical protein